MTPQAISGSEFGVGVLGSILTGVGDYQSGKAQQSAYDYNADISLENMRSEVEANQQKFSGLVGTQAGRYAAAGVDIASGSPLLIMAATAARGAERVRTDRGSGNGRSEFATLLRKDRSVPGNHERDWRFFIWIHKGVHILLRRHSQDTCTNGKLICQRFPESGPTTRCKAIRAAAQIREAWGVYCSTGRNLGGHCGRGTCAANSHPGRAEAR